MLSSPAAGWGVFQSGELCCAPGAGFTEGCNGPVLMPLGAMEASATPLPAAAELSAVSVGLPGPGPLPAGRRLKQL
jgi:hypothetical protein